LNALNILDRAIVSGLLQGQLGEKEPDDDINDLSQTYLEEGSGSNFWVAELSTPVSADASGNGTVRELKSIIGMIGVNRIDMHTVEIRRLRVDPSHRQRGVGTRLIEVALQFCREQGYLKVLLDTRVERTDAIALFERFGFQLTRTREVEGKQVHDFYLNLYRQSEPSRSDSHMLTDDASGPVTSES